MQVHLELLGVPNTYVYVRRDSDFAARVQKLRWMGLDDEADQLFDRCGSDRLCEVLVSTAPDTD